MSGSPRLGVVVLGMHRSGTSAAARLVNLMGFSPGPEDDLLPPQPDNPAGFWENESLVALNDEILLALKGDWSGPPNLDDGWEARPELDGLRLRASEVAASVLGAERWVWKDPRACLTLPFWLPVLDCETAIVLVHRNPLEVAESLRTRHDFPVVLGLALWERYVRSALSGATGRPVCVTSYGRLVADPAAWCRTVEAFLQARGVETATVAAADIRATVRSDLKHAAFSAANLEAEPVVSVEQRAIYAALEGLQTSEEAFTPPALPPETPWVEALLGERRQTVRAVRELAEATAARLAAEAKLASIEQSGSYRLLAPLRSVREFFATRST